MSLASYLYLQLKIVILLNIVIEEENPTPARHS